MGEVYCDSFERALLKYPQNEIIFLCGERRISLDAGDLVVGCMQSYQMEVLVRDLKPKPLDVKALASALISGDDVSSSERFCSGIGIDLSEYLGGKKKEALIDALNTNIRGRAAETFGLSSLDKEGIRRRLSEGGESVFGGPSGGAWKTVIAKVEERLVAHRVQLKLVPSPSL